MMPPSCLILHTHQDAVAAGGTVQQYRRSCYSILVIIMQLCIYWLAVP